jgi:hypothetical protein
MTRTPVTGFVLWGAICGFFACTPDDRCGDDYYYSDGVCVPGEESGDSETGCPPDTDSDEDPDNLGAVCDNACNPCLGNATFCVMQPGAAAGYCTISDCATTPDDCPEGYACCDGSIGVFCATDADFAMLGGLGFCGGDR